MMPLDAYARQTENGGRTRRRIFRMLASGMAPKEVACHLGLSVKTVEYHWHYIKKMLGVKIASQLPWIAWKRRWATATGKWIKAFMSLALVTSAIAADQPPKLPKTYKQATGIGQGAGALQLITITPTITVTLYWTNTRPMVIESSTDLKSWSFFSNTISGQTNLIVGPILPFSFFRLRSAPYSVTLEWDPSPSTNVTSYMVYYGNDTRTYTNAFNVGNFTNATVTNLVWEAKYYFAVTARDDIGLESDFSNEVSFTNPARVLRNLAIRITP